MFDFEWFKKKTEPVEPIEVGSRYSIIGRKADPWGVGDRCVIEVTDTKDGWVRYSFVYKGKRSDSSDEVQEEKMFREIFEKYE